MIIYGTALLAVCHLLGVFIGDMLGSAIGVKANVGGVGIAMLLLVASRYYLHKYKLIQPVTENGVQFWAAMYIPVVIAMAAQQNVVGAMKGGTVAIIAAILTVASCFVTISVINRTGPEQTDDSWKTTSKVQQ